MADARPVLPALRLDDLISRKGGIPEVLRVQRTRGRPGPPLDVGLAVSTQLESAVGRVSPGESVAIAVGSRGIARIDEIVAEVVARLRAHGAHPYIVPAMGSHGARTAAGQTAVLADLGITDALGAPVRASMETVLVGKDRDLRVHTAREALAADHILVINRLKSHTSYSGRVESGLAKMVAIGLAKQRGAEELHRMGPLHLEDRIVRAYRVLASQLPILGGLAVTEGSANELVSLDFVGPEGIGGEHEAALLERGRSLEARLPFPEIDVLLVDVMGKEISGTGMDTNVLGRRMVRGSPEPSGPRVTNVVVLEVTPGSEGNAVGLGLADFIPVAALERVDLVATYANALTAGLQGVQRAQLPIALATARDAVRAALMTAGLADPLDAKVVRIRNTLALDDFMVTPNLLTADNGVEVVADAEAEPLFDAHGRLLSWDRHQLIERGTA